MGALHSKKGIKSIPENINLNNWKFIQSPEYIKSHTQNDTLQTYANIITKEVVHRFRIETDKQQNIKKYYQARKWRNTHKNIVHVSHIFQQNLNSDNHLIDSLCSNSKMYRIYVCVQQIIIRLSAIKDIPYPQNLYFLIGSLDGFQLLFNLFGYFQIDQDMICIDKQGKIKVWMNSNLSQNSLNQNQKIFRQKNSMNKNSQSCQTQFVNNIIKIVCRNTDEKSQPQQLYQYLNNQANINKISFAICRKCVLKYAEQFKTYIPQSFASIIQILNQGNNSRERSNRSRSQKQVSKVSKKICQKQMQSINQSSPLSLSEQNHILYGKNYNNNYLLDEDSAQKKRMHTSSLQIPQNESQNHSKGVQNQKKQQNMKLCDSGIEKINLNQTNNQGQQHSIRHEFTPSQHSIQSPTLSINKKINNQSIGNKRQKSISISGISNKQDQGRKITFSYALDSRNGVENQYPSTIHNYQPNYRITQSNVLFNQNYKFKKTDSNFVHNEGFIKATLIPANNNLHQRNSIIKEEYQDQLQSNQNPNSKQVTPRQTKNQIKTQAKNLEYQKKNFIDENKPSGIKKYDQSNGFNSNPSSKKSIKIKTTISNQYDQSALVSPKKVTSSNKKEGKIAFKDPIRQYELDLEIAQDLKRICMT